MIIKSYAGDYKADFFSDFSFLDELKEKENKFFIIDKRVFSIYETELSPVIQGSPYYLLDAIEENKNVDTALGIIRRMVEMDSKRNTLLVTIGGGIAQDVSAFIANILYRGISWILIPTTLLAQTDSCIGSKSSLNFEGYKNLLGYFYPPKQIYINTKFIHTLDRKDYLSGLGEIMKCAIMDGYESFLSTNQNMGVVLEYDEDVLLAEITKALNFKKQVIEKDEFDRDFRNIMNFGHTFGHALESASDYAVPHGQGVSIGMLIANQISFQRGYISERMIKELNDAIGRIITPGLIKKEYFSGGRYLETMKKDKKFTGKLHTCILFEGDGVKRHSDIRDEEIVSAIEKIF